jgi:SPP1 gp7 family putative phage head morphogenesis protein
MNSNAPTIRGSAQARLLLYRLLTTRLTEAEKLLLSADPALWEQLLAALEERVAVDTQTLHSTLKQAFSHIERSTREGLQKQIKHLSGQSLWLGIHPSALLDSFVDEHQRLIKSIGRDHLDKVGMAIKRGIREGRLQKDLARDIRHVTDTSKKRAQLIARNAPLQFSGALTKHHQTNAGIKKYRWQTSDDERVRSAHREKNNKVYEWSDAGPHPRSEVNCRCDAIPVLE